MTGLVHGIDPYRAWARAVVDGELDAPWNRKYAVGCAFLRGMGQGRVVNVSGIHETHEQVGRWIAEALLHRTDATVLGKVRKQVLELCEAFPLYADRHAKAQAEVRA
jgi:hypothetical protein